MKKTWLIGSFFLWILVVTTLGSFPALKASHEVNNNPLKLESLRRSNIRALDFTIQMLNETELYMGDLLGKVILLDLMSALCSPCIVQVDQLQHFRQIYEEITIVSVSITLTESIEILNQFINDYNISWLVGRDIYYQAGDFYNVTTVPTMVLIDSQGSIRYYHEGVATHAELEEWISELGHPSTTQTDSRISTTSPGISTSSDVLTTSSSKPQTSPSFIFLTTVFFLFVTLVIKKKRIG